MTRHPDKLHLSAYSCDGESRTFRVDFPFRYFGRQSDTVPEGFLTDGGSLPRFCWSWFASPTGLILESGVPHDHAYSPLSNCADRKAADLDLRDGCIEAGMSRIKAEIIYRAVRMFGGRFWKTKKRHECYDPSSD